MLRGTDMDENEVIEKHVHDHAWSITNDSMGKLLQRLGIETTRENILIVRQWLVEPCEFNSEVKPDGR